MKLFKQFSVYTIVGFLNAGISFFILPILTHYLTPADYGIISLVNTYVTILVPFVGLSTASLISVEYYNKNIDRNEFKVLFSSVRLIPLLTIIPLILIFILGSRVLPGLMELPAEGYWLLLPLTLFTLYQDNFSSFLVISKRVLLFSVTTLGKIAVEIPLTVILIVYAGMQWEGRIYAWLAAIVLLTLISVFCYLKWNLLSVRFNKGYISQALVFGTPLILHQVGKFVIDQSDKLFLAKMISVDEMGIYSVGYRVGMLILILVNAFTNFYSPFLYQRLHEGGEKEKKEIVRVSYIFLIALFAALLLLTALSPLLFEYLIDKRYEGAIKYIFWIGLGYFFWAIYTVFAGFIFFLKKSKILGYIAIVNIVLNIGLNFIFY
ncbi:MAG: oligosaccharide flippase family protein [Chitinophagales bacterium]|nr:oligosaccharide flippase family protein [Chitinophagales bacterium]